MKTLLFVLLALCQVLYGTARQYNPALTATVTNLLNNLLDKKNYDKNIRPGFARRPVIITTDLQVLHFGEFSEKKLEFSVTCYFRQTWVDDRLRFDAMIGNRTTLMLESNMLRDIWKPDTFVRNGRHSYIHQLTVRNIMLRVSSNGEVLISQRLTINARCPMYFSKYPMDTQACPLTIGSLGYSNEHLVYRWTPTDTKQRVIGSEIAQYTIVDMLQRQKNITNLHMPTESLSIVQYHLILRRQQGYYILQIYTPCTLIVVMSWVSFWINKEASPARVALGVMTVLSIATVGVGHRNELPRVSYSTAMDIYIVICFAFVFGALIEYAVINFAHLVYIRKTIHQMQLFAGTMIGGGAQTAQMDADTLVEADERERLDQPHGWKGVIALLQRWFCCRRPETSAKHTVFFRMAVKAARARKKLTLEDPGMVVDRIDTAAKFLFPTLYVLFNGLYWTAYLYVIPDEIDQLLAQQGGRVHGDY